jgi:hypothetical protein
MLEGLKPFPSSRPGIDKLAQQQKEKTAQLEREPGKDEKQTTEGSVFFADELMENVIRRTLT